MFIFTRSTKGVTIGAHDEGEVDLHADALRVDRYVVNECSVSLSK